MEDGLLNRYFDNDDDDGDRARAEVQFAPRVSKKRLRANVARDDAGRYGGSPAEARNTVVLAPSRDGRAQQLRRLAERPENVNDDVARETRRKEAKKMAKSRNWLQKALGSAHRFTTSTFLADEHGSKVVHRADLIDALAVDLPGCPNVQVSLVLRSESIQIGRFYFGPHAHKVNELNDTGVLTLAVDVAPAVGLLVQLRSLEVFECFAGDVVSVPFQCEFQIINPSPRETAIVTYTAVLPPHLQQHDGSELKSTPGGHRRGEEEEEDEELAEARRRDDDDAIARAPSVRKYSARKQ